MNIELNNLTLFYLALSIAALIGLYFAYIALKEDKSKQTTTTTIHKIGR